MIFLAKKKEIPSNIKEIVEDVQYLLNQIADDQGVPRNIRKIAQESIQCLQSMDMTKNTPGLCASNSRSQLDDITQDLNCPLHVRTKLYQVLSLLEQIQDE